MTIELSHHGPPQGVWTTPSSPVGTSPEEIFMSIRNAPLDLPLTSVMTPHSHSDPCPSLVAPKTLRIYLAKTSSFSLHKTTTVYRRLCLSSSTVIDQSRLPSFFYSLLSSRPVSFLLFSSSSLSPVPPLYPPPLFCPLLHPSSPLPFPLLVLL